MATYLGSILIQAIISEYLWKCLAAETIHDNLNELCHWRKSNQLIITWSAHLTLLRSNLTGRDTYT